jgi:hypothetical protein
MESGIRDTLKASLEEDGVDVDVVNRLTVDLELGMVLIEVSVNVIDAAILLDCMSLQRLVQIMVIVALPSRMASLMIVLYTRGKTTLGLLLMKSLWSF